MFFVVGDCVFVFDCDCVVFDCFIGMFVDGCVMLVVDDFIDVECLCLMFELYLEVDVLVVNVGMVVLIMLCDMMFVSWCIDFDVNFIVIYVSVEVVLFGMCVCGCGVIVIIGLVNGVYVFGYLVYSVVKVGLISYMKLFVIEYGCDGVCVNIVLFGMVKIFVWEVCV